MIIAQNIVLLLILFLCVFIAARTISPSHSRAMRRRAICEAAVDYAEQLGGPPEQKKLHALGYAQIIDLSDNRKRDYTDSELSVEIESVLGSK